MEKITSVTKTLLLQIHQVRRLVFDNYTRYPVSLICCVRSKHLEAFLLINLEPNKDIIVFILFILSQIGDFAILLRSGFDRWRAAKAQVCTATGGLCGALLALMSESAEKAGKSQGCQLTYKLI